MRLKLTLTIILSIGMLARAPTPLAAAEPPAIPSAVLEATQSTRTSSTLRSTDFCEGLLDDTIRHNAFTTNRNWKDYGRMFGGLFKYRLRGLGSKGIWLDVGAGNANAMIDYATNWMARLWGSIPRMIALGVTKPPAVRLKRFEKSELAKSKFEYLVGRYLNEYEPGEIPKVDIITDNYGAASYAVDLSRTIALEGELLKPDGLLFIAMSTHRIGGDTHIVGPTGERVSIKTFFENIQGLELVGDAVRRGNPKREEVGDAFVLRRTGGPIVVPKLEVVKIIPGTPPRRYYLWR